MIAVMLTRHWREDGRSHDNTSGQSEPRRTHDHRETDGEKTITTNTTDEKGNKKVS